jgi:hypothetical protein
VDPARQGQAPLGVHARVTVGSPLRGSSSTTLVFSWTATDPLAVVIDVSSTPAHPALPHGRWVVLRDFLRYGCEEPTGDGKVRIAPAGRDRVSLRLLDGTRPYVLESPVGVVADFLDQAEREVPSGTEASEADLDELVSRLLAS